IAAVSLKYGEQDITKSDWYSFIGSLLAIVTWALTKNPAAAAILITIIDTLAFYPTFRKSWHKPYEDSTFAFTIATVKFAISLFALENISIATFLYPLSLVVMNGAFVIMLIWRRHLIPAQKEASL